MRLGAPLSGGTRVEEELALFSERVDRNMAVPEYDQTGTGKASTQACTAPFCCAAVVYQRDTDATEFEKSGLRKHTDQVVVVVAEHRIGLSSTLELCQRLPRGDVARVEYDICPCNSLENLRANGSESSGEMAVGEDDHFHSLQYGDSFVGQRGRRTLPRRRRSPRCLRNDLRDPVGTTSPVSLRSLDR